MGPMALLKQDRASAIYSDTAESKDYLSSNTILAVCEFSKYILKRTTASSHELFLNDASIDPQVSKTLDFDRLQHQESKNRRARGQASQVHYPGQTPFIRSRYYKSVVEINRNKSTEAYHSKSAAWPVWPPDSFLDFEKHGHWPNLIQPFIEVC